VRLVYSDRAEETGTLVDPIHVDVGTMGRQLRLREVVKIDGVPYLVATYGGILIPRKAMERWFG
jgi:hypothetical protein